MGHSPWTIGLGGGRAGHLHPGIARGLHDPAQHCAFSIALWLAREGAAWLHPPLTPAERTVAQVEGWILGVPGR